MVEGRNLVDIHNHNTYSSIVKVIIVKLPHVITHKKEFDQFCGYISNDYVNEYTNEKVYVVSGKEFGYLEGSVVLIRE